MTTEEAIKKLRFFLRCHESWLQESTKEAIEMAISARRAQQEPVKLDGSTKEPCEYCKSTPFWGSKYCYKCGRPLTEEA